MVYNMTSLTSEGEDSDADEELRHAVSLNPGVSSVEMVSTRLTNVGVYSLMSCHQLTHLTIVNTDMFQVDWDEGVSVVLAECGHHLVTLVLDRFKHVDIGYIGSHCHKLTKLQLTHVVHYGKLLHLNDTHFLHLEELTLGR